MKNINQISDIEIDEIINGCIEGVYPTSHEVAMALELKNLRSVAAYEQEPVAFVKSGYALCYYRPPQEYGLKIGDNLFRHPAPSIPTMPADLHPDTQKLVADFSTALAEKLHKAQLKYGHSDNWSYANWEIECQTAFHEHIAKGDPRDVAAYCAFMWFHGWKTEPSTAIPESVEKQVDELTMWVKRLAHSLKKANPDSGLHEKAMDYLHRASLVSTADILRTPSIPAAVPDEMQETPDDDPEIDSYNKGKTDGWNACRAAMLQSEPAGWIPVSERMPEWKSDYRYIPMTLLLNGRTVVQGGFDDGSFWLHGARIFNVTAWQPLPAAPKGV